MLISFLNPTNYVSQIILLLVSCVVMAFGVLLEIKTEVVYLGGDEFIVAVAKVLKQEFGKIKPYCDVSFIIITATFSFVFLGYIAGIREGTVISAIIICPIVRIFKKHLDKYIELLIEL